MADVDWYMIAVLALVLLGGSASIVWHRYRERETLRRIGYEGQGIRLTESRPWLYAAYIGLMAAGVLILVGLTVYEAIVFAEEVDLLSSLQGVFTGGAMISTAGGLHQRRLLFVGTEGVHGVIHRPGGSSPEPLLWKDVIDIQWDRDIGQQQFGVTVKMRVRNQWTTKENVITHRFYVARSARERVAQMTDHAWKQWRERRLDPAAKADGRSAQDGKPLVELPS